MASNEDKDGPGVVYVGRIPHGFYENEMRQYFSQFGTITKLRLSRNRKTGHSKHFAFIEFESSQVAKIVAEAMNNYLMYGHIVKCEFVQPDALHPDTFKGANKPFRAPPYNKLEKRALEAPKSESQWMKKNLLEQAHREKKAEKLKAMGYDFDLPRLKSPTEVLQQRDSQNVEHGKAPDPPEAEISEVPAAPTPLEDGVVVSAKKSRKEKVEKAGTSAKTSEISAPAVDSCSSTSDPVHPGNVVEQTQGKLGKRKEKREKTSGSSKQLATGTKVDDDPPAMLSGQPAKTGDEGTTAISDPVKASSQSSKKRKRTKDRDAQPAANETLAPTMAISEVTSSEKVTSPSVVPTESVTDGTSKKKTKKRKTISISDKLAASEPTAPEPPARGPREQRSRRVPKTKGILEQAEKT